MKKIAPNYIDVTVKDQYLVNKVVGISADCAPIEQPFQIFNSKKMLEIWWEGIEEDRKKDMIIYRFIDGKNPKMYTITTNKKGE
jgi:hypothetical protein